MKFVLAFLASVAGIAVGFGLGAIAAGLLAPLIGIRSFEGEAGYFAVFIGGPVGAIVGLLIAGVVALRLAGYQRLEAILLRLGLIVLAVVALGATTIGVLWLIRPVANTNGAAPQLVFEIRLPPGAAAPTLSPSPVELQTSKNIMPATLEPPRIEGGRTVIAGNVDLYYRTWRRLLVLRMPDKTDILFNISVGLGPSKIKNFGAWQQAEYVAEPGHDQARKATPADTYEIRYRTVWPEDD